MTNKEKIEKLFLENPKEIYTAEAVAELLSLKRNAASALLNELAREGSVEKKKTRPVLFSSGLGAERTLEEDDPFTSFDGYNGSLKSEIAQCRIASTYPGRGIPLMILGESGVGKSLLARYIYEYSKYKNIIPRDAPFVVLNCADYSNNKELLSAALFGYKKGAFTGADKDTEGIIESANRGYLFLDEVHRLSEEGQEKLFRYMDYGVISRMGSGGEERPLNVRLIFATTEDVNLLMLDTFLRRIPLTIRIKSYNERNYSERLSILYKLFYNEGINLGRSVKISKRAVNRLTSFCGKGNVGTLKNIVKISCARAYGESEDNASFIQIDALDLSLTDAKTAETIKEGFNEPWLFVDTRQPCKKFETIKGAINEGIFDWKIMEDAFRRFGRRQISEKEMKQCLIREFVSVAEQMDEKQKKGLLWKLHMKHIELARQWIQEMYGLGFDNANLNLLAQITLMVETSQDAKTEYAALEEQLCKYARKACEIGKAFCEQLQLHAELASQPEAVRLAVSLYFYLIMREDEECCNALIVARGRATASSMAGLVNRIYDSYLFDAIDMPYEVSNEEITRRVKGYLSKIDTRKGVLLLIDMGALTDLKNDVGDMVKGDFGIVTQVSTRLVVEAGNWILQKCPMEETVHHIADVSHMESTFIAKKEKPLAIVVCCISGIGTAVKIGEMFKECIRESMEIEVKPNEYVQLKMEGKQSQVFKQYRVLFIVSTVELEIQGVNILLLTELISEKGQEFLYGAMENYFPQKRIRRFIGDIVKSFSMRNIINQLVILNPERIIEDVDNQLAALEQLMGAELPINIKEMLFIHISIMTERLIMEPMHVSEEIDRKFARDHEMFIRVLKKSFFVMEKKYNVSINERESRLIYDIISYKQGFLGEF